MIYINSRPVSVIAAKDASMDARMIALVVMEGRIVWQIIRSCFGQGYWIEDRPWLDDDTWKD